MDTTNGFARGRTLVAGICASVTVAAIALTLQAALPQQAEATTDGWTACGSCEYQLDDGTLTIRPEDNGTSGYVESEDVEGTGYYNWGWESSATSIKKVVFEGTCYANSYSSSNCGVSYMFSGCSNLTTVEGLENLNTASAKRFEYMFSGCSSLTSVDVSTFSVNNAVNMEGMFYGCSSLTSVGDMSGFNTGNLDYASYMFYDCSSLTSADISSFDFGGVAYLNSMFSGCSSLKSVSISGADTSGVKHMHSLFLNCSSLTSLDLSSLDTSNVKTFTSMFSGCSSLKTVDVSDFDTTSATSMAGMFKDCSSLASLDVSNFDTTNVTAMDGMFSGDTALRSVTLGSSFAFVSSDSDDYGPYLPTPVDSTYGSGLWRNQSTGTVYSTPSKVPSNTAATYDVVYSLANAKLTLSASSFTYNGKAKKPGVTVKLNGKKLGSSAYSVSYASGRKTIGRYAVTVKGSSSAGFTGSKTVYFTINPAAAKVKSAKVGKKKMTIKLSKVKGGVKYQIKYRVKGSKKWKTVTVGKNSKTIKKLTKGKKYQVKARAFKKVKGKTYASSWSKVKTTKKVK